jgi:uridine phosphorylase
MGAPSAEIVLNEISALAEVDGSTRTRRFARGANLTIIRVGTSGALQPATSLGTAIISSHAVGLDSSAWFYAEGLTHDPTARELAGAVEGALERVLAPQHPAFGKIHPYGAVADVTVVAALSQSAQELGVSHEVGATITASGFFAPQGRHISRVAPSVPDIDRVLARDPRFLNMDMETSFVLHLCGAFGYRAGAVCVAAAHRELDTFSIDIVAQVSNAVRVALWALARVQSSPG